MKKVSTERFALVGKGGQYVKPSLDDSPYLFFRRKMDAEVCLTMDRKNAYKIVKVRITIEPVRI
jgi:hypothetical protein